MLNGGGQGLFDDYIKVSLIKSVTVSKKEYKYAKSRDAIYGRPLSFFVELLSTWKMMKYFQVIVRLG